MKYWTKAKKTLLDKIAKPWLSKNGSLSSSVCIFHFHTAQKRANCGLTREVAKNPHLMEILRCTFPRLHKKKLTKTNRQYRPGPGCDTTLPCLGAVSQTNTWLNTSFKSETFFPLSLLASFSVLGSPRTVTENEENQQGAKNVKW